MVKNTAVPIDAALQNSGGIRLSIPAGPITVEQIFGLLPFSNVVSVLPVSGDQIVEALENGVSEVELESGRFPQVQALNRV